MKKPNRAIANNHFIFSISENGCVDKISPVTTSVQAVIDTIGAIADDNARYKDKIKTYFDPLVTGDCLVHDLLIPATYSLRHGQRSENWNAAQNWSRQKDHWQWQMEIKHRNGPARELKVELILPHPIFPGAPGPGHSNWQLWLPVADAPFGNDYGIKKVHFSKCLDELTDMPLPLGTLFHHTQEISLGFSYLLPPEQTWYVDFEFNQRAWQTKIVFHNIALTKKGTVSLRLWCFSHAGDWRPALGWVRRKFPQLLGPVPGQEKLEGNMAYTVPMIPEKRIRDWSQKMHLRWNELFHCRNFGDYVPQEPFDSNHFKTPAHPEWSADNLTYDDLNRYIDMCHTYDVKVMPYFNIGECESEIARKRFPESIVKTTNGEELTTWVYYDRKNYNILMNCDPAYPWFSFIIEQFERLQKKLPGIDGFFFDQMSYGWIDTAHFDGVTFYNNRPAYNLAHMYLRAFKVVRNMFPRPHIVGLGNGPMRWQQMEFIDGAMAEGDPRVLGRVSMLCPERPTICLAEGEQAFQNALYYGSWLHVSPYHRYPTREPLPPDALALFARYHPLFEFLKKRKWIYAPHPLLVDLNPENIYKAPLLNHSDKIKANIFKTFWGEYAVVITALPRGAMLPDQFYKSLKVKVNVPGQKAFKQAVIFSVDYRGYYLEKINTGSDGSIELTVPRHNAATMIILTRDFKRLAAIQKWRKFAEKRL